MSTPLRRRSLRFTPDAGNGVLGPTQRSTLWRLCRSGTPPRSIGLALSAQPLWLAQSANESSNAFEQFVNENGALIGIIVAVVGMAAAGGLLYAAMFRHKRQRAMAPNARRFGLVYTPGDPGGLTEVAFPLLRAGDGRRIENAMWRDGINDLPITVFDYTYWEEHHARGGQVRRSYEYFSCCLARHNGLWPTLGISREQAIDKFFRNLGLPDVDLESEEFNQLFRVKCEDRKFATDLLSPEMMHFLLRTKGLIDFETKGRWLLLTTRRVDDPKNMVGLVEMADSFLKQIPPVLWDLYPKAPDVR